MRVSQVLHAMDKDDTVVIVDLYGEGDEGELYCGFPGGVKRDDPLNRMHVDTLAACDGDLAIFVKRQTREENAMHANRRRGRQKKEGVK